MDAIREIIDVPELKNSVLNSKLCVGRINLRGVAVAVVDFAQLLEVKSDQTSHEKSAEQRIIIARIGEASIGLLVDAVDNIFSYFPGDVLPVPLFSNVRSSMFGGCIQKEGVGTILYLNHEHIFSSTEIIDLTRGHTELYQQENAIKNTKVISGDTQRKVYITFSIGSFYALEIAKMREIIDCPTELVKPPRMPAFVEGVFSLRRRMVTILNLRCFYQMKQIDQVGSGKILIVERDNELFGLMVDAVENIVTVSNSDRIRAPRISDGKVSNDSHNEIHEVLQITRSDQENETINVFNIDSFFDSLTQEMEPAPV
jgi:purine-binding chemotaxis protein CheW